MLSKKFLGELIGTTLLVAAVVGSGAMAQFLTQDIGVQLLINTIATVLTLGIIIFIFADVSGAHFNPLVSFSEFLQKRLTVTDLLSYIFAQFLGGVIGVALANTMFSRDPLISSEYIRTGRSLWLGEIVATAGLLFLVQMLTTQGKSRQAPVVISAWIGAAYFFTSSTSFANPAVTFARAWTDTFSGIALQSVPLFIVSQVLGAIIGIGAASIFTNKGVREDG